MPFTPVAVIHYHEIALKGRNREWFERQLIGNIRWAIRDVAGARVQRMSGRVAARFGYVAEAFRPPRGDLKVAATALAQVFGIANFLFGYEVRQERKQLIENTVELVKCQVSPPKADPPLAENVRCQSFAVRVKRGNKSYPATSQELERELGAAIADATGLSVDLEHPDLTVAVEIVEKTAFVLLERVEGPGGLPVGISGRVLTLLSSGFDSPVAAWRMMKRGCVTDFIHFHSYPYTSDASIRNVEEIVRTLNAWQQNLGKLFLVPLIEYQKQVMTEAPTALRVLLYRRMMFRVAERIAARKSIIALVTGENLGQVASQTIPNIAAVEAVATLPVFRPLLGYDKMEIIRQAEAIGTAVISSRPYDDCCSLFTPQHPATHATAAELDAAEASLGVGEWAEKLYDGTSTTGFSKAV